MNNMQYDLPSFDELKDMAQNEPEKLEALRVQFCEQLIAAAPEKHRRRLRGLQFRIDMERRKAKSPMASCINVSGMMHESFDELRAVLNEAAGNNGFEQEAQVVNAPAGSSSNIIPFRK